jgi:hypothetical protein
LQLRLVWSGAPAGVATSERVIVVDQKNLAGFSQCLYSFDYRSSFLFSFGIPGFRSFFRLGVAVKNLWRLLVRKIYKNFRIIILSNVNYCFYSRPSLSFQSSCVCLIRKWYIADNQHFFFKLFTNSSDKIKKRWPSSVRTNIMSRTISSSIKFQLMFFHDVMARSYL